MLLALDIGNSSISVGVFTDGDEPVTGRLDTHPLRTPEEYRKAIESLLRKAGATAPPVAGSPVAGSPEGAVISSVVPGHTEAVKAALRRITGKEPVILNYKAVKTIKFAVDNAEELGADRIAAALAAIELYGAPVAVVDFGTATTVSFIDRGNIYRGGAIMPGLELMSKSLATGTAQLPEGVADPSLIRLANPFLSGTGTASQILFGIIYGTAGAVERIIAEAESLKNEKYRIAATGGYLAAIRPYLKRVDYTDANLVLKGLKFVYNSSREPGDYRCMN